MLRNWLKGIRTFTRAHDDGKNLRKTLAGFPGCKLSNTFNYEEGFAITYTSTDFFLNIEEEVYFRKYCHVLVYPGSSLFIRKNVFFNNFCSVNCLGKIEIGENTLFGEGVKLYDHNHQHSYNNEKLEVKRNDFSTGTIKIGKNCWIGSNVTILKDVEIGDNVIIGANCLIYKSIPSNSIVKLSTELIVHKR